MSIDSVKISHDDRNRLSTLKRRTGVGNWNILCRWAFCTSIAIEEQPRNLEKKEPDSQELSQADESTPQETEDAPSGKTIIDLMTWATFGGDQADVYLALLKTRCIQDNITPTDENLALQLKLHLHRGIGYLVGGKDKVQTLADLATRAAGQPTTT